jgi:molybdopterin-guanine dinucleotide biosynthesis protein A
MNRSKTSAAILVGGQSTRMGAPKSALLIDGRALLEIAVAQVAPLANRIALVGRMDESTRAVKDRLAKALDTATLEDDPAFKGPLAGIVSVMESAPDANWLVLSCDMPTMSTDALRWLLDQHDPASPATVGALVGRDEIEPFPAVYQAGIGGQIRSCAADCGGSLRRVLSKLGASAVSIPSEFAPCWRNCNTPDEWQAFLTERRRQNGID